MTIIYHRTADMFEMEKVADYIVNPTTLRGDMEKGIALEFVKRFPKLKEKYFNAIDNKKLFIGGLQTIGKKNVPYQVINMPTKNTFMEKTNPEFLSKALEALREKFLHEKNTSIVMPLLGQQWDGDYCAEVDLFEEMLGDTEATFYVCIHPKKTKFKKNYLVICGSSSYEVTTETFFNDLVESSLRKWNMSITDFDKVITVNKLERIGKLAMNYLNTHKYPDKNIMNLTLSHLKVLPDFYRALLMFYSGTHFIILDRESLKIPYPMLKLYSLINNYNEKCEKDSPDLKLLSNDFYKDKLKNFQDNIKYENTYF